MSDFGCGYRERLYSRYVSTFKSWSSKSDDSAARRHAKAYRKYLRGWIPCDRQSSILDVGCGDGAIISILNGMGYRNVRGVDRSPEQVMLARSSGLEVQEGDATSFLQLTTEQWDLVLAIDVLEHLTRDEALALIDGVWQALRCSGRIVVQVPNVAAFRGMAVQSGDLTHEQGYSPDSLTQLLAACGFDGIEFREARPVRVSFFSGLRSLLWPILRGLYVGIDLLETGARSSVYSRVMLATATKPDS